MDPLRKRLINSGPIPFRDFMEQALYDDHGDYYSTNIQEVGRIGDFSTSTKPNSLRRMESELHPVIHQAIRMTQEKLSRFFGTVRSELFNKINFSGRQALDSRASKEDH